MLEPTGPLPAAVYWRRRAVAAGGCVLSLVLLVWIISGLVGGADEHPLQGTAGARKVAGSPSSPPSSSSRAVVVPSQTSSSASSSAAPPPPAPLRRCPDSVLEVVARPDIPAYRVGEHPLLRMRVVNRGKVPCTRDVGRRLRELVIAPVGGDRVWSSNDCIHPVETDVRTLLPGKPLRFSLNWAGRTSVPGCPADRVTVRPGRYVVAGKLGEVAGPAARLTLTP